MSRKADGPKGMEMRYLETLAWFMFLAPLAGCEEYTQDSAEEEVPFCYSLEDGDDWKLDGTGGGSTSGTFTGRLITDAAEDYDDGSFVANIEYTVENIDVGGTTQTRDRTDSGGYFEGSGAAGTWRFMAGAIVDNRTCNADMTFEVEVGNNTTVCAVLSCE